MKKILIATSALTALTLTPALALDVKTSGTIEYYITSDDITTVAEKDHASVTNLKLAYLKKSKGNRKLSQKQAHVKFSVEGMSSGIAYGSYVTLGSGTNTPNRQNKSAKVKDISATLAAAAGVDSTTATKRTAMLGMVSSRGQSKHTGQYTQKGQAVNVGQTALTTATTKKIWVEPFNDSWNPGTIANNARTRSALWVSGGFGKVIIGQDSSAAENAFMGDVKAARFFPSTLISDPRGTHRTLYNTGMERITYETPEINGFQGAYTKAFKGNVSTNKQAQAVGPQNHAITYKGDMNNVKFKLSYMAGRDKGGLKGATAADAPATYKPVTYKADAPKGTAMAGEVEIGKFTVGYNKFTNKKRYYQKQDTGGSIMGVRYFDTFWTVGYTRIRTEDKNTYFGPHASSGSTDAITGTVWIDRGFKFYASRATNTVKYKGLAKTIHPGGNATGKSTHTMFGIQATF